MFVIMSYYLSHDMLTDIVFFTHIQLLVDFHNGLMYKLAVVHMLHRCIDMRTQLINMSEQYNVGHV